MGQHLILIALSALFLVSILDDAGAQNIADAKRPTISFTAVPGPGSGPDSRGDIAGVVHGVDDLATLRIVLYAHTDDWWWVQPLQSDALTEIDTDGNWSNWTHLGRRYAALLVSRSFEPRPKVLSLPTVGGDVLSKKEAPAEKAPSDR